MIELDHVQLTAIEELRNGNILRGGVGVGKSRTAFAYYFSKVCGASFPYNGGGDFGPMATPKDIYVITTAKKRNTLDWDYEASEFLIGRDRDTSFGKVQLAVDSWNNITEYANVKDAFFVFDEQRLVGNGAWVKAFYKIAQNNQWIMLSGTPGDIWMDYVPVFIANGFFKNRSEFNRNHVVYKPYTKFPQVDRYVGTKVLNRFRDKITVEMPYNRHTIRHILQKIAEYDQIAWKRVTEDRWNIFEDEPIKDVGEMFRIMRKVVNSDSSRLGILMELLEKHPRLIVFYNFDYELEMLRTLGPVLNIPLAEYNGHKHENLPETDKWLYLVQYRAGAEGWNCTTTDAMAFYSLTYSYKDWEQSQGRIDRRNTPFKDLFYYVIRSGAKIDIAIARSLAAKKNFNEKEYVAEKWSQEAA